MVPFRLPPLRSLLAPLIGLTLFLAVWQGVASQIDTSLGKFPGPIETWQQFTNLIEEYQQEKVREQKFYEQQRIRNEKKLQENPNAKIVWREYRGMPTYLDKIQRSLITVASGFLLGSLIAIPVGLLIGISKTAYSAINPIIQVLKPISPLAWLPLVTIVISAVYESESPLFDKAYLTSMFVVMLCSLWPTIINTAAGVGSVTRDMLNVSRVLRLSPLTHLRKIVLPCTIPSMFTGLRISLGIAWMVLIAAEMLAQNPGLGKFVWDEFQNGSSQSLARIMVAVVTIGIIGFLLDRLMLLAQRWVSWDKTATLR
ncbi:ABC transporter permease [Hydrogenophilus thermoluteolus]|nr:ABC transporter permease [Hydrogenophilus thermoluteolus]MBW7656814.1 ABC transporter permease [Hydrogenophilus thermoluteolus]